MGGASRRTITCSASARCSWDRTTSSSIGPVSRPGRSPARRRPRARTPPAPRREFWVQVGAFHTTDVATRLVQRLRRHAVTMALGGDRQGLLARVLVGPFAERAAAVSTVRALHARGLAAFLADSPE